MGSHQRRESAGPHRIGDDVRGGTRRRAAASSKPGTFSGHLKHRFRDLLDYLEEGRGSEGRPGAPLHSLTPTLSTSAKAFATLSKDDDKRLLLVILLWWNAAVPPEHSVPETGDLMEVNRHLLDDLTVETLALYAGLGITFPWESADIEKTWNAYEQDERYTAQCPPLPHIIESVIRAAVANHHLAAGDRDAFVRWCRRLADDEGRRPVVRDHALASAASSSIIDVGMVLRYRNAAISSS